MPVPQVLVLWTGPKHSGKTTAAIRLVQAARAKGFVVAGCLAPSIYANDLLTGFDIIDLRDGRQAPLAQRETGGHGLGGFRFLPAGLELGNQALGPTATKDADLIIVDEYGPLELEFRGWRAATDRLMTSTRAVLLLVVREELAEEVRQIYGGMTAREFVATKQGSADEVLALLANHCGSPSYK